ncbi:MAG: GGDEF domain-containing protein [Clostridia bacterium]|nr:GGDEF domain-containing protein [Clostridia bacterium]
MIRIGSNRQGPTIGVLVSILEEACQSEALRGIIDFAEKQDSRLVIFVCSSLGNLSDAIEHLNYRVVQSFVGRENVNGLIIFTGAMGDYLSTAEIQRLVDSFKPLPVVSIATQVESVSSILVDNYHGMYEVVEHLIKEHGCRRIAFVRGPEGHEEAFIRFNAYKAVLNKYQLDFDENLIVPGMFSKNSGIDAVKILLDERKVQIDGIVAVDDDTASGVLAELHERGIRVPFDIALTGFDDTFEAKFSAPPITTVKQQFYEQGQKSMETILNILQGNSVHSKIVLPTKMVIRESCGCFSNSVKKVDLKPGKRENLINGAELHKTLSETVCQDIEEELNHYSVREQKIGQWVERLVNVLVAAMQKGEGSDDFLHELRGILFEYLKNSCEITLWHNILTILRNHFVYFYKEHVDCEAVEDTFQKARVLVSEMILNHQIFSKNQQEYKLWQLRQVSQNLIITFNLKDLLDVIEEGLEVLGIESCYISLYEKKCICNKGERWVLPEKSKLVFAYENNKRKNIENKEVYFESKMLMPSLGYLEPLPKSSILMPLSFKEEHFGFIVYGHGSAENVIYETLRSNISSAIKGSLLFQERKKAENELVEALKELSVKNNELKHLSTKDELTSLYNRRGFLELAESYYKIAKRHQNKFLILFADLDKLKLINDNFGHKEGDAAIIAAGQILKQTFRQSDIIGRMGGDEFTVLAINACLKDINEIKNRIQRNIDQYNMNSNKPYQLSLSVGAIEFDSNNGLALEDLMVAADYNLYQEKQKKRKKDHSIISGGKNEDNKTTGRE